MGTVYHGTHTDCFLLIVGVVAIEQIIDGFDYWKYKEKLPSIEIVFQIHGYHLL